MSSQDGLSPLQTVDRALQILSLFTPTRPEVTVAQATTVLGVSRSVASRLLAALEARHFVVQDPATGRFRLGVRNLDLGALFLQSHRLVTAATPYLEQLGQDEALSASANLFVFDAGDVLRLASYPARPLTRLRVQAHCTAAGKVLLANLPNAALDLWLAEHALVVRTVKTISDPAVLRRELDVVRQRGYAIDAEESWNGGYCYAAPIDDVSGRTVGAVSVTFTIAVAPAADRVTRLIHAITESGRRISESLGSGEVLEIVPAELALSTTRRSA